MQLSKRYADKRQRDDVARGWAYLDPILSIQKTGTL